MAVTALVFLPVFILIFVIAIPVLVGVLVYNDARRRGLPPLAWALTLSISSMMKRGLPQPVWQTPSIMAPMLLPRYTARSPARPLPSPRLGQLMR